MNKLPKQFFDGKVFLHQLCVPACMNRRLNWNVGERSRWGGRERDQGRGREIEGGDNLILVPGFEGV